MYILETLVSNADTNGVAPQVASMGPGYRWDDADSVTRMPSGRPLATPPNLRSFTLDDDTNATDLVSQGFAYAAGLLASPAFRAALRGMTTQAREEYPAEVVHAGATLPYWWLHMAEELESRIDFHRSEFMVVDAAGRRALWKFSDPDDMARTGRELVNAGPGSINPVHVVFAPGTPPLDLFTLRLAGRVFFVSDALAEELNRRELTGFELVPTDATFIFE